MDGYTRSRACIAHPNTVVAKRELQKQEYDRLRRLSNIKPTHTYITDALSWGDVARAIGQDVATGNPKRPVSAASVRSSSYVASHLGVGGPRTPSGSRPGTAGPRRPCRPTSRPRSAAGGKQSEFPSPGGRRPSFMVSPQRRFEDAQCELHIATEEEERALREELDTWYFGSFGGCVLHSVQQQYDAIPDSERIALQHKVMEREGMGWVRDFAGHKATSEAPLGNHAHAISGQYGSATEHETMSPPWKPNVYDVQTAACLATPSQKHFPRNRGGELGKSGIFSSSRPSSATRAVARKMSRS